MGSKGNSHHAIGVEQRVLPSQWIRFAPSKTITNIVAVVTYTVLLKLEIETQSEVSSESAIATTSKNLFVVPSIRSLIRIRHINNEEKLVCGAFTRRESGVADPTIHPPVTLIL